MAGFLYFIPGKKGIRKEDIDEVGLDKTFYKTKFSWRPCEFGPSKSEGCIFIPNYTYPDAEKPRIGYFPDKQEWKEVKKGSLYIGVEKDNPVRPEDLQRSELISGYELDLNDGNTWIIPIARIFTGGTNLESVLMLGPEGELVKEILPRFVKFGMMAERLWEILRFSLGIYYEGEKKGELPELPEEDGFEMAIEALSINYIMSGYESSLLKIITSDNLASILHAVVDYPKLSAVALAHEKASKKKESVEIKTGKEFLDGTQENSEPISPPLQTSSLSHPSNKEN